MAPCVQATTSPGSQWLGYDGFYWLSSGTSVTVTESSFTNPGCISGYYVTYFGHNYLNGMPEGYGLPVYTAGSTVSVSMNQNISVSGVYSGC
jgi:hypothetical protein